MLKRVAFLSIGMAMCILCNGCNKAALSHSDLMLDTVISVTLYHGGSQQVLDGAFDLCREYERIFSRTIDGSDIDRLNHAGGEWMRVSPQVWVVLETALSYSQMTDGRYDVTILPVVKQWDFTSGTATLPDESALNEALTLVGWRNIAMEEGCVQLQNGVQIDLGSIAKGYIADCMADYLVENGVSGAIINLGGDIRTVGTKPRGKSYRIGIQRPFADHNETIGTVEVAGNQAVASSGIYERSFELNGRLYHHILDSATGYPAETGLASVTVISGSAMDSDALATCFFLLGREQGMELAESLPEVEAVFLTDDNKEYVTSGFSSQYHYERTA